ncbi:MAG: UPF0164 family protein [bacterium]|nr:UPF0164 family protein [bacterium]
MKKRNILFGIIGVITLASLAASTAVAQEQSWGQPGAFLRFGSSARSLGMGGAGTGLADDASSLFYNPAGMEQVRSSELIFFHAELSNETRFDYIGFVQPFGGFGTLGLAGALLNSGGYERATLFEDLSETFSESQNALQISFAKRFGRVSGAITYRNISQSIDIYNGTGSGLDLSIFSRPHRHVSLGIHLQNVLAPEITLLQESETFPLMMRMGGALHMVGGRILAAVDMVRVGDAPLAIQTGIEYRLGSGFALRTGWDTMRSGYAAGGGYRSGAWQFDYSVSDSDIGLSHRASLTWRFGVPLGVSMNSDIARFSPSGEQNKVELQLASQFRGNASGWELVIYDGNGRPCHSAAGDKAPPEIYSWGGADDQGRLVPSGMYRVVIVVLDEFGDPWTQETSIEIRDYDPGLKTPIRMEVN